MQELTSKQAQVLAYIQRQIQATGQAPSYRQIAAQLGVTVRTAFCWVIEVRRPRVGVSPRGHRPELDCRLHDRAPVRRVHRLVVPHPSGAWRVRVVRRRLAAARAGPGGAWDLLVAAVLDVSEETVPSDLSHSLLLYICLLTGRPARG